MWVCDGRFFLSSSIRTVSQSRGAQRRSGAWVSPPVPEPAHGYSKAEPATSSFCFVFFLCLPHARVIPQEIYRSQSLTWTQVSHHCAGPPARPSARVVHFHSSPSLLQLRGAIGQPQQAQGQDPRGLPALYFFCWERPAAMLLWRAAPRTFNSHAE